MASSIGLAVVFALLIFGGVVLWLISGRTYIAAKTASTAALGTGTSGSERTEAEAFQAALIAETLRIRQRAGSPAVTPSPSHRDPEPRPHPRPAGEPPRPTGPPSAPVPSQPGSSGPDWPRWPAGPGTPHSGRPMPPPTGMSPHRSPAGSPPVPPPMRPPYPGHQ